MAPVELAFLDPDWSLHAQTALLRRQRCLFAGGTACNLLPPRPRCWTDGALSRAADSAIAAASDAHTAARSNLSGALACRPLIVQAPSKGEGHCRPRADASDLPDSRTKRPGMLLSCCMHRPCSVR